MTLFNYENPKYLKRLKLMDKGIYSFYIKTVKELLNEKDSTFLDIGFGSGYVIKQLVNDGYLNVYGCEISSLFVREAKKSGLKNIVHCNEGKFPFKDNQFKVTGSLTVLEHVKNPVQFLSEQIRVTQYDGYFIVACPNYLNVIFQTQHPNLGKISQRIKNLMTIIKKIFFQDDRFIIIQPLIREHFQFDDDVICLTNLIDIEHFLKNKKCKIIYSSGFLRSKNYLTKLIDKFPVIKYFCPSCFIIAKKYKG